MHAWERVLVTLALGTVVVLSVAAPAYADGTGDAWTDGSHVGAGAGAGGTGDAHTGGGGSGQSRCEWRQLDPEHAQISDKLAESGLGEPKGAEPGSWYRRICYSEAGLSTATIHWVADRVDPAVLARQAADQVPIPAPGVSMNPGPSDGAVVNVETWLWVDPASWQPVAAQASAGGVVVTATASPRRVLWDMGNGDRVTCAGPGTPYDSTRASSAQSTDCSYTYRQSSARAEGGAYTVTATVVWEVSWTVTGAAGGGSLGTAPRSQSVRLPVKEIQAVNR